MMKVALHSTDICSQHSTWSVHDQKQLKHTSSALQAREAIRQPFMV